MKIFANYTYDCAVSRDSVLRKAIGGSLIGLGLVATGLGIASPVLWPQSDYVRAISELPDSAPRLLASSPGVLGLVDNTVTIEATVPVGDVTLAIGREPDVTGWLGNFEYTKVLGLQSWESLASAAAGGGVTEFVSPVGSDMWLAEATGAEHVSLEWPGGDDQLVVLIAGYSATPNLTLTWPREVTTPYRWPLIAAGIATILLGTAIALSRARQLAPGPMPFIAEPSESAAPATGLIPVWPSLPTEPEAIEVISNDDDGAPGFSRSEKLGQGDAAAPASADTDVEEVAPVAVESVALPIVIEDPVDVVAEEPGVIEEPVDIIEEPAAVVVDEGPAVPGAITATTFVPPVSRSQFRAAKVEAETTGNTELLEALTGAIRAVPEPAALTSQIPIATANWRSVWGLGDQSYANETATNGSESEQRLDGGDDDEA